MLPDSLRPELFHTVVVPQRAHLWAVFAAGPAGKIDFRDHGATKFTARIATTHNDPVRLEVRLDSVDGPILGSIRVPRTGGSDRWAVSTIELEQKPTGVHDLFFVVNGRPASHLMYFDYWMFSEK